MTPVLVPYRGDDGGHRDRNWRHVRNWWREQQLGPVHPADAPGRFNRSAARNRAAELAGDWQVAIFADADTFMLDSHQLADAIDLARAGRVVLPHTDYVALTTAGTERALRGMSWQHHVKREVSNAPLGIVVIGRQAWDELRGFDERFTGWGGEDVAYRSAAETLGLLERIDGTLVHLWHPNDPTKVAYIADHGGALRQEYRMAHGDPAAMRELLEGR